MYCFFDASLPRQASVGSANPHPRYRSKDAQCLTPDKGILVIVCMDGRNHSAGPCPAVSNDNTTHSRGINMTFSSSLALDARHWFWRGIVSTKVPVLTLLVHISLVTNGEPPTPTPPPVCFCSCFSEPHAWDWCPRLHSPCWSMSLCTHPAGPCPAACRSGALCICVPTHPAGPCPDHFVSVFALTLLVHVPLLADPQHFVRLVFRLQWNPLHVALDVRPGNNAHTVNSSTDSTILNLWTGQRSVQVR